MAYREDSDVEKQLIFLNPEQLSRRWGMTRQHLAELRHRGGGCPFHKMGRLVRYKLDDVLAYEQASQREPGR